MRDSDSNKLRPIDAFVKYFLDVKPYHTKLLEVVERYKFAEDLPVEITDSMFSTIAYRNNPLCKAVGFGLVFDECGFSNDNCCDLFQCLGGYGIIWDNSDLVGVHQILRTNTAVDEIEVAGNFTFDRRLQILKVEEQSLTLRGDQTNEFLFHKLFLIAPFNVYSIDSASNNTLSIVGDVAAELTAKREIKVNGTAGRDGLYGVNSAQYNPSTGLTVVTVAGSANFNVTVTGAYIETETQPRNQGFYQVDRAELVNGNTVVFLKSGTTFPVQTSSDNGSVQLRTALSAPRRIWLSGTGVEREYRVADAFYDVTNDRTHIVLAEQLFTGETYNEVRLHGYMTSSGFDNDEECDMPKPTNLHAVIGEKLVIRVHPATTTFSEDTNDFVLSLVLDETGSIGMRGLERGIEIINTYGAAGYGTLKAIALTSFGDVICANKAFVDPQVMLEYMTSIYENGTADPNYSEFFCDQGGDTPENGVDALDAAIDKIRAYTQHPFAKRLIVFVTDVSSFAHEVNSTAPIVNDELNSALVYRTWLEFSPGNDAGGQYVTSFPQNGKVFHYPFPYTSLPPTPTPTATVTITPTPSPTATPITSQPFYEKYMYAYSANEDGVPGRSGIMYGKVTGATGVETLAKITRTGAGNIQQTVVYNDILYVTFRNQLSVFKYANGTLEEVQTVFPPSPSGFLYNDTGYQMNSSKFGGLGIDPTTGTAYVGVDMSSPGMVSKSVISYGPIDPATGFVNLTDTISTAPDFNGNGYGSTNYSTIHTHNNLLVFSVLQDTYPDSSSTGTHRLYTINPATGGITFVASAAASSAASINPKVTGHGNAIFERAANAVWAYKITETGIGPVAYGGFSSGLGSFARSDTAISISDDVVRLFNSTSTTIEAMDKNIVDGTYTTKWSYAYTTDGRPLANYVTIKLDTVNNRAIIFDTASPRRGPAESTPMFLFDGSGATLPSSVTALHRVDNVLPLNGEIGAVELLDYPLPQFAITPTPTATTTLTPTPTPTNTMTPTPSLSFGAAQPYVTSTQTAPLGSNGLTPIIQNASVDDSSYKITLPFNFYMFGTDYGVDNNGGVYVGTNSYLTAGVGSSVYSSLAANRPGRGIITGGRDNRLDSLYSGIQDGGKSFRIRYEADDYSSTAITCVWEMTFYQASNLVQLVFGDYNFTNSVGGISDGTSWLPAYSFQPNTSYVLQSDASGNNWTITPGSVEIVGVVTPTPSLTKSITPTPTPTKTTSPTPTPTPTPSPTLTPTPTASPVYGNSIYNKLVAWWEFDENDTEARFVDAHGNHSFVMGSPSSAYDTTDAVTGNAAKMPSVGAGLWIPRSDSTFDFTNNTLSFAGWTKVHSTNGNTIQILGKAAGGRTTVDYLWNVYTPDGNNPTILSSSVSPFSGSGQMFLNQWHFFHMWNDPQGTNTAGLRIDLQPLYSSGAVTLTNTATSNLSLGGEAQNDAMGGGYSPYTFGQCSYDALACFSEPLTDAEYRWLYNSGQGRTYLEVRNYSASPAPLSPTPTTTSTPTPTPTATRTPTPTVTPTLSLTPTASVEVTPFGLTDDGYTPPNGDVDVDF